MHTNPFGSKNRNRMTYRITITAAWCTYHIDGGNKRKLRRLAKALLKEYKVAGTISEPVALKEKLTAADAAQNQ